MSAGNNSSLVALPREVVEQVLAAMQRAGEQRGSTAAEVGAMEALRAALEQPQVELEPVAWANPCILEWAKRETEKVKKLTRKAQPAYGFTVPLYTHPQPKREPLTDEEIAEVLIDGTNGRSTGIGFKTLRAFARAIERAHGIGRAHDGQRPTRT